MADKFQGMKVAVIVPCLNEEITVAQVVRESKRLLPQAAVYVIDNGSTDGTAEAARAAGATVIPSPLRGKGNALRHAFRIIDADFYVMTDGDGTYGLDEGKRLLEFAVANGYEMVTGSRLEQGEKDAFRPMHFFGNRLFTATVRALFRFPVHDLLTGLRVFSRRFVRETNLISRGFEIETELTIRAIAQDLSFCEVPIAYVNRPRGSKSKLNTFRDGFKILFTIVRLWKDFKPLPFYTLLGTALIAASFAIHSKNFFFQQMSALSFALGLYMDSRNRLERMQRKSSKREESVPSKKAA